MILRAIRVGGRVVAIADWRILGPRLFLNGLAVDGDHRGQGHGTRLFEDGASIARALHLDTVELGRTSDVAVDNELAVRLYRRMGLTEMSYSVWEHLPIDQVAEITYGLRAVLCAQRAYLVRFPWTRPVAGGFAQFARMSSSAGTGAG